MSAFEAPNTKPVQLGQVRRLIDRDSGLVLGLAGLNTDPDRCPAEFCPGCPRNCRCAPCRCPECMTRDFMAREQESPTPGRELV